MKTKAEKLALLWETAAFYNLKNRAVRSDTDCVYYDPQTKNCCAIGRKLSPEHARSLQEIADRDQDGSLPHVWDELPGDLQDYGQHFLSTIQTLHDGEKYWTDEGLSEDGFARALNIARAVVEGRI